MSISFVRRFNENENATSITYKKYSTGPDDVYPTFSICFRGTQFHWTYDLNIYDAFALTSRQYKNMLKGKPAISYQYDNSLRLFRKIPTFVNNGSNALFNKFHLQFSDFLLDANFTSLNPNDSISFKTKGVGTVAKPPFHISYHSPDFICFARDSTFTTGLIRLEDSLTLNKTLMKNRMYADTKLVIFIHYPGQLIRSLDIASFSSTFSQYRHDKLLLFKISQSTVIRERSDYHEPCNNAIKDYDTYLMTKIISEIECIPSYWIDNVQDKLGFKQCTSQEKLQTAYNYIKDWKTVMKVNDRPCVDMYTVEGWNWLQSDSTKKSEEIHIKFYYQEQYYQELKYLPDFDLETFISNIGGFVGIFLGYSMMQFPELIGNCIVIIII